MGKCSDFLELYQLCQTAKQCMGADCPNVTEQAMEQARLADKTRESLHPT